MLYNDRKMKKWQGFILSEHSNALKRNNQINKPNKLKEHQSEEEIGYFLENSYKNGKEIKMVKK